MARKYKQKLVNGKDFRKTTWLDGSVILKLDQIALKEKRSSSDQMSIFVTDAVNKYKL